jgi:1A family penicillin-binding protein
MAFLKFLFYALLFFLIKIGDLMYSVFAGIGNALLFPFIKIAFLLKPLKHIKIGNTFKIRKGTPVRHNTIRRGRNSLFKLFSGYLKVLLLLFKKLGKSTASFLFSILKNIGLFLKLIRTAIFSPFTSLFRYRKRKRALKVQKEALTPGMTTSLFYKLKYVIIGTVVAFLFFFLPAIFFIFISDLPKLSNLSVNYIPKSTKILDRNGNLLFEIYANQNRTIVSLGKIPKILQEATIAIEDKDFYKHGGFDLKGIARAFYVDITRNDLQGGSTITQQLIKSALLTPEPTITRKVRELALAFWAERKYTKNQILELYFNYVPYGGTAWGVEAASQIYFGKDVSSLTLPESAYLAGLPQAPSQYSPFTGDGSLGKKRQKEVLDAMVSQGYITRKQAAEAYAEKLAFQSFQVPIQAPHFVMYVKDLLVRKYGLSEVERGGLQVTTTLDISTQKMAEGVVADEVDRDGYLGIGNGAALVTNPKNGDILAMVGSRDYFDTDHDGNVNITTSLRQPGSTIKLITYALALSKGFTEATILDDVPLTISSPGAPPYTPVNYDGRFHGKVPLRIAFANSFNIPAVRVAQKLGVESIVSFAKQMGITSWGAPENYGLSITLGAAEVTMTDLATAYGTVANNGERVNLDPILQITDSEGKVIQRKEETPVRIISPGVAFIISDILSDGKARSIEFGSNSPLTIENRRVSVKTGTTDNKRDNWTIGYTPDMLVATWVGNNDNTPLSQALASGITGAAPMWNRIMTNLLQNEESAQETIPDDVVTKKCFGYDAYFIRGTENTSCRYFAPTPTPQQQ